MEDKMTSYDHIKGTTAVYGLIGDPVEHTLSPLIHNTLAGLTGQDLVYVPWRVKAEDVGDCIRGAYALNVQGLNVTVPHKIGVMEHLKSVDEKAAAIGAVNTLIRTEGGYAGYNTDHMGLKRALEADGITLTGRDVVILGAGGAARAAAFLCAFERAGSVYIMNRSTDKARSLCEDVNEYIKRQGPSVDAELCKPLALNACDELPAGDVIAIQATSVGLYPHVDEAVITDDPFYTRISYGYDMVYKPAKTRFMKLVTEHGGRAACGLKMLMYQGVAAYELWRGIDVSDNVTDRLYPKLSEAAGIREDQA